MNYGDTDNPGFADPVDPRPHELRAWAYHPEALPPEAFPPDWDLLVAGDALAPTLFELAMDRRCPTRRFALHCLYIYAAQTLLPHASSSRRRKQRLRGFITKARQQGDDVMRVWAHNCQVLDQHSEVFQHSDWLEGGLVRRPELLNPYRSRRSPEVQQ